MSYPKITRTLLLAFAVFGSANAATIAFDYLPQIGNQTWTGSLGMDFNVNTSISVTALGAFNSGGSGFTSPISVSIYDRVSQSLITSLSLGSGAVGTLVNGERMVGLVSPIYLPAGFQGTIVTDGYGAADPNGNTGCNGGVCGSGDFTASTMNTGGGQISFVGSGRYSNTSNAFPATLDSGPANRYGAGTFAFDPAPSLVNNTVAYNVTAQIGNQGWTGPLGMDFDVNSTVRVTALGVFDSGADGLSAPLTVYVYDRDTGLAVATLTFPAGTYSELIGGSRFLKLPSSVTLPAGFHGSIVAEGYGRELNGNLGCNAGVCGAGDVTGSTENTGGGLITFTGAARYGTQDGQFPTTLDSGPDNRYLAGTFAYDSLSVTSVAPEPGTIVLMSILPLLAGWKTYRTRKGR